MTTRPLKPVDKSELAEMAGLLFELAMTIGCDNGLKSDTAKQIFDIAESFRAIKTRAEQSVN